MKIEVVGTGCAGCRALYETVLKAVEEMGIDADVVKEESLERILASGVSTLAALVIDAPVASQQPRLPPHEAKPLLNTPNTSPRQTARFRSCFWLSSPS